MFWNKTDQEKIFRTLLEILFTGSAHKHMNFRKNSPFYIMLERFVSAQTFPADRIHLVCQMHSRYLHELFFTRSSFASFISLPCVHDSLKASKSIVDFFSFENNVCDLGCDLYQRAYFILVKSRAKPIWRKQMLAKLQLVLDGKKVPSAELTQECKTLVFHDKPHWTYDAILLCQAFIPFPYTYEMTRALATIKPTRRFVKK
jgi:hypothetical protein